jgi:hypothetical protein
MPNKGLLFLFFFILKEFYLMIPCYWRVLNLVPKQYSCKLMDARECSPKSMVPIFIVLAQRGLLGIAVLVVPISVSRVLFRPWVLAAVLGCLTKLSTCFAVSTSLTSLPRLVVAMLVASSPPNWVRSPSASLWLLFASNSSRSLKACPKCYIQQIQLYSIQIKYRISEDI